MAPRMSLRLSAVILDAHDVKRAAAFWGAALGYETTYASDKWMSLAAPGGGGVELGIQPTEARKRDVNRVHLDLAAADVQAEVARLERLGARRAAWPHYPPDPTYVVMEDTEGNEFCVVPAS